MIIKIDDEWRLKSDQYCWRVEKFSHIDKKSGDNVWRAEMYYPTIEKAARGLAQRLLRDSDAQTLANALKDVELISDKLCEAFKPHVKVEVA